jgi:hypothetical protein
LDEVRQDPVMPWVEIIAVIVIGVGLYSWLRADHQPGRDWFR